jgi:four helix bundle protein
MTRSEVLARDYGLKDQIQRSAVSMMTNIAEGFERTGAQEKLHFYNIARASAGETRSLLYVVEDNYPDLAKDCLHLRLESNTVGRKITGLITRFRSRQAFTTLSVLLVLTTLGVIFHFLT